MTTYLLCVSLVLSPGVSSNLLRLLESLLLVSRLLVGGPLGLLGLLEGLLVEGGLLMDNCDEDKRSLLLKKIKPPAGRQAGQAAEVQAGNRLALSWAAAAGRQGKTSAAQPARPWFITNGQTWNMLMMMFSTCWKFWNLLCCFC